MDLSDVGACAILTIERFQREHGERPGVLYFGPEEYAMMQKDGLTEFYGIPVFPMAGAGVMARAAGMPGDNVRR